MADQVETFDLLPKGKLFPPRLENSEEDLNRLGWDKGTSSRTPGNPCPAYPPRSRRSRPG